MLNLLDLFKYTVGRFFLLTSLSAHSPNSSFSSSSPLSSSSAKAEDPEKYLIHSGLSAFADNDDRGCSAFTTHKEQLSPIKKMIKMFGIMLFLSVTVPAIAGTQFQHIVVFGDSLSDIGNNDFDITSGVHAPITNQPVTGNRKLWPNYLVTLLNFKDQHISLPAQMLTGANTINGYSIDYAWAGAESANYYIDRRQAYDDGYRIVRMSDQQCPHPGALDANHECLPGLQRQVRFYLTSLAEEKPDQQTLFMLWSGGNDLFDNIADIFAVSKDHKNILNKLKNLSVTPALKIAESAKLLIQAGVPANHIAVFNLPDLSKTPAAAAAVSNMGKVEQTLFLDVIRARVDLFNSTLKNAVKPLKVHMINDHDLINNVIKHVPPYDKLLPNVKHSCIEDGFQNQHCLDNQGHAYLFFNDRHPTTNAGYQLALYIQQQMQTWSTKEEKAA